MGNNGTTSPFASLTDWWLWAIVCLVVLPPMEAAIWQLISGLSHLFLVGTLGLGIVAILTAFLVAYSDKKLLKASSLISVLLFVIFVGYAVLFHYQEKVAAPSVARSGAIVGSGGVSGSVTTLRPSVPTLTYAAIGALVAVLFVASILIFRRSKRNRRDRATHELPPMRDTFTAMSSPSHDSLNAIPSVIFNTAGLMDRHIDTGGQPQKLRFVQPKERIIEDLPASLQIGKGRVVVKRFTRSGFLIDEDNTVGDLAKAEVYYADKQTPAELAALKAQLTEIAAREYPPVRQSSVNAIAEDLLNLPATVVGRDNRHIGIRRDEFGDCIDLADALARAFRSADWRMS